MLNHVQSLWRALGHKVWNLYPYRSKSRPVIVGGCGRSGTTLMRAILDTHSHIACGPETGFFFRRAMPHRNRPILEKTARKFDFSVDDLRGFLRTSKCHAEFIDRMLTYYANRQGKPEWAEKSPGNVNEIDYIFTHFPRARFIHMIRDPRDTVCSLRTHPKYKVVNGERVETGICKPIDHQMCLPRWLRCVSAGKQWRHDARYIEVRYEDLVRFPESTLRQLFSFLGYSWEDRLLEFHKDDKDSVSETKDPQNADVLRPISTSRIGRYKSDLEEREIRFIEARAGAMMQSLGYEPLN